MGRNKSVNKEPGVHIKRSEDGKFFVTSVGFNSEALQDSETLEMKASCLVNIAAMIKLFSDPNLMLIDETKEKARRVKFSELLK